MDVVKTRLQTGNEKYSGIRDCSKFIYSSFGIKGFFKGLVPRVMIVSVYFIFVIFSHCLQLQFWYMNFSKNIYLLFS